jgi:hypothetical protein
MNTVRNVFICPPGRYSTYICSFRPSIVHPMASDLSSLLLAISSNFRFSCASCSGAGPVGLSGASAGIACLPQGSFGAHPPRTARCLAFLLRLPCHAAAREALWAAPDRCELATRERPCGLVRRLSPSVFGGSRLTRRRQVLAVALSGSRQRVSDVTVWGELLRVTLSENGSEVPS